MILWRINQEDRLIAMQRIRGRRTMLPKPGFGKTVLYNIFITVKLGKAEARWKYGVWLDTIEASGEHTVGTEKGLVKCRPVATLAEDKRFDAKLCVYRQGTPWKPSPRYPGWRI